MWSRTLRWWSIRSSPWNWHVPAVRFTVGRSLCVQAGRMPHGGYLTGQVIRTTPYGWTGVTYGGRGRGGRVGNDNAYWDWRDEQLKASERAKGGEPCQVCGEPVPARAHWKHRDRHVCSPRCNLTLNRRFNRRIERGEITRPPVFSPDPQGARPARAFRTLPADSLFPYEIQGYSPKPGDVVERHGSVVAVHRAVDLPDYAIPWQVRPHRGSRWRCPSTCRPARRSTTSPTTRGPRRL